MYEHRDVGFTGRVGLHALQTLGFKRLHECPSREGVAINKQDAWMLRLHDGTSLGLSACIRHACRGRVLLPYWVGDVGIAVGAALTVVLIAFSPT